MELQRAPSAIAPDLQRHLELLENARHYDPFAVLGPHEDGGERVIRAYLPEAARARLDVEGGPAMERLANSDLFQWRGAGAQVPEHYRIRWYDRAGGEHVACDPYCFAPQLPDFDLYLFGEGRHLHVYRFLGAHPHTIDGIAGVLFAVWAPGAERVSVVGNFNHWDGRRHPMRVRGNSGVWELFLPGLDAGELYKFEIRNRAHGTIHLKTDPYGRRFEMRPATAAVVEPDDSGFGWGDQAWLDHRAAADWLHVPMSMYEVHLGSWQRDEAGNFLNYRDLAHRLVDYVKELGFTHIELLPVTEHPLDASWGYQTVGYFAPTSRYGSPDDFRYFVDYCHRHNIGVLLDWAPGHFPKDAHGLARFDGSAVYEHEDPRQGEHRDWGTLIFNYSRNEVRNFLVSSALYWMQEFHIDGLRVDAVASMLYLDYSREDGDWVPNIYGGRENLGAIDFLRQLNEVTHGQHPGTLIIAEESTAWPQVTRPVWVGGLGFSMKWNMGWMHDTLQYLQFDPVHRHYHHDQLTFGLLYAFSLYTYMFTYPGKKLLFMGCEYGQGNEWDHTRELDWWVLQYPVHSGVQALVRDLNRLYREHSALFRHDFEQEGFEWIDCHDASQSVLSYLRRDGDRYLLVVLNFTPVPREHYRIGVPAPGSYRVIVNSDSSYYGGSNLGDDVLTSEAIPWMDRPHSIQLTLPPLAGLVIEPTA
ncbi:MAG: 1,4-alpha-glucan branching enzyme [Gammaproteobacteria bacterium]